MTLLDKFAMDLATDLEKQGSSNSSNATVEVKMDNIGEFETQLKDLFAHSWKRSVKRDLFCLQIIQYNSQLYPMTEFGNNRQ